MVYYSTQMDSIQDMGSDLKRRDLDTKYRFFYY